MTAMGSSLWVGFYPVVLIERRYLGKQELSRQRRVVLLTIPQIGTDHAFPGTFSTALQCLPGLALATLARI
jgi:hypothetical protein